jgi:hypothetical protein
VFSVTARKCWDIISNSATALFFQNNYLLKKKWVQVLPVHIMKSYTGSGVITAIILNPLNAELNPICHLLALLGAHLILHVNRIRVNLGTRAR